MWAWIGRKIEIDHMTWQLLAVVDFFSRKIVTWDIMPSVESKDIRVIYRKALDNEGVGDAWLKPRLRLDQGSPNTARFTKGFFLDMGVDLLSLARIRRPTDNALTERFFGSLKQEEVYIVGSYPDERSARDEIGRYIAHYNTERPHQALWNFTPDYVHEVNNKSEVLAELESLKFYSAPNLIETRVRLL
jgi:putative transposase